MPKPSIVQHSKPKDYRPISLTSFVLKTMERLVERYIIEELLAAHPLHDRSHAYQTCNSVDTALAEAVTFMNGAFNHTTKESIVKGAEDHLVPNTVSRWLWRMLSCRRVKAHWGSHSEETKVGKGCPQGGVLSPTMW